MEVTSLSILGAMSMSEVLVAIVAIVLLGQYFYIRKAGYWVSRGVPHVPGWPLLGSSPSFALQTEFRGLTMQRFYKEAQSKGQPCLGLYVGGSPILLVCDQELVRSVFTKDFDHFMDRGLFSDREGEPLTANLFMLEGPMWRPLRQVLTPPFSSAKMRAMFPLVHECADELAEVLSDHAAKGTAASMTDLMNCYTIDVIGSCVFGIQVHSVKDTEAEFHKMGRKMISSSRIMTIITNNVPHLLNFFKKIFGTNFFDEEAGSFFTKVFLENVAYRKRNNVKRHDFVDLLIALEEKALNKENGSNKAGGASAEGIEADMLPAQAFIFFVAGFETTASTLALCFMELAHHPNVQEKVRAEVQRVMAQHGGKITYDAIGDLKYTEQVLMETMRLYPIAPFITRVVTEDYPLATASGQTAIVEKGVRVCVPVYAIQRDPLYFRNPNRFDPDHFSEEAKRNRPNYTFLAFGEGPRNCIGLRFAMTEMKAVLACIFSQFRLSPVDGDPDYPICIKKFSFVAKGEGPNLVQVHAL